VTDKLYTGERRLPGFTSVNDNGDIMPMSPLRSSSEPGAFLKAAAGGIKLIL